MEDIFTEENKELVREAHGKGRHTVELEDRLFRIEVRDRVAIFTVGGERRERIERWLMVAPVVGLVPVMSIELSRHCNVRSASSAS